MVKNTASSTTRTNTIAWLVVGTVIGCLTGLLLLEKKRNRDKSSREKSGKGEEQGYQNFQWCHYEHCGGLQEKRKRLPELVILLRHGESEANADHTLWRTKPDNQIKLTDTGIQQSKEAGRRIEALFESYEKETSTSIKRVQIHVSPFERTLQTIAAAIPYFEHRVVQTLPESRIREQETGNFSKRNVDSFREEQLKVGRFWYRFPTGESGADVYDRVKSWWFESILTTNEQVGYDHVDAIVVVTHSLSMRFVLMQLYNWSPTTFHSVWSSGVCDMYVLRKDLNKRGTSPYDLDRQRGDMPRSSMDMSLRLKQGRNVSDTSELSVEERIYRLHDYLDVPPPRMRHIGVIKQKLAEEYPKLDANAIDTISFELNGTALNEEQKF